MPTISPAEGFRNTCIICAIIALVLLWRHLHDEATARRYFTRRLNGLNFCGFSLEYLLAKNLPTNLDKFLNLELSEYLAVLMMFPLRKNRTAHIVKELFDEDGCGYWHSWVEFRFFGTWYMVDPLWYEEYITSRPALPSDPSEHPEQVYSYDEFWSLAAVQYFYQQCQKKEASLLLYELILAVDERHLGDISDILNESSGQKFIPIWFKDQRVINKTIFDMLTMAGPRYCQPSEEMILSAIREETQYRHEHPSTPKR